MNVTFYSGFSKRRNSTKQPSGGTTKSVVLKENTSEMRPAFVVSNVDWSWNYASWGGRYYYINDIVSEGNNLFRVECELDVMATFKVSIGSYTTLISRAAADENFDVMDTIYPAKTGPTTKRVQISSSGIFTGTIANGSVVMGTVGNDGQHFYVMSWARFTSVCYWLFPALGMDFSQWALMEAGQALAGGNNTVLQSITLLKWLPITYTSISGLLSATTDTHIGNWTMPHANSEITGSAIAQILGTLITFPARDDNGARGKWLYTSPFAEYSVYIPPFGLISVDGNYLLKSGRQITADIMAEIVTGNVTLRLYYALGNSAPKMIGVYNANVGLDMRAGGGAANLGGIASGIGSAIASAISDNYMGAAASLASAARSFIPQGAQIGGGVSGPTPDIAQPWFAYATYYDPIDENQAEIGRPLGEVRTISSLSGFIQCADAHCPLMGHEEEMTKVNEILNNGFFYE